MKKLLAIIVTAAAVVITVIVINKQSSQANTYKLPEFNENGEKFWADADRLIEPQIFSIDATIDTVIETKNGIVMYIPDRCFVDENGSTVTEGIELEIKEALDAESIIQAGLSSTSGDKLLESAGMFYINARKDGKTLQFHPDKEIYTEVPTNEIKPGMQLFEGKRMEDGSIDWVDPKPLEKFLTTVDINTLNFFPRGYEPKLKTLMQQNDKAFKDSLYYSFAWEDTKPIESNILNQDGEKLFSANCATCHSIGKGKVVGSDLKGINSKYSNSWIHRAIRNFPELVKSGDKDAVKIFNDYGKVLMPPQNLSKNEIASLLGYISEISGKNNRKDTLIRRFGELPDTLIGREQEAFDLGFIVSDTTVVESIIQGINPAKIKAIWNKEFNNSIIATKEFEERLQTIFTTCNDAVLDLYINNLNKNLYEIDEMAVDFTYGYAKSKFEEYANRKDGKVDINDKRLKKLQKHYKQQQKLITKAIVKTKEKFEKEQKELLKAFREKRKEYSEKEVQRLNDNFKKELDLNLKNAYWQLGKEPPVAPRPSRSYRITVTRAGWKNVDVFVKESLQSRETLDYTDPNTGKKAVIKYEPLTITIANFTDYDRAFVYLLPNQLNSFMRVKQEDQVYKEKLNELIVNDLICLAYKGKQAYLYSKNRIAPGNYKDVALKAVSDNELTTSLKQYNRTQQNNMFSELEFQYAEIEESIRKQQLASQKAIRQEIEKVIFPCNSLPTHVTEEVIAESDSLAVPF